MGYGSRSAHHLFLVFSPNAPQAQSFFIGRGQWLTQPLFGGAVDEAHA